MRFYLMMIRFYLMVRVYSIIQLYLIIQGPGDHYVGIAYAMKRAHSRVVLAMGGDVAFAEMLERLPLSPQDHDIISLSSEVAGWSDDLMARPKAKAKSKAAGIAGPPPPVAASRIGLALHRRPQVPASNVPMAVPPPPAPAGAAPSNSIGLAAVPKSPPAPIQQMPPAASHPPVQVHAAAHPPVQVHAAVHPPVQVHAAAHPPVQVHAAAHPPVQVHAAALHPPPVQVRPPPANRTVDDLLDEARAKAPAPDAPPPIMAAESHEAGGPDSHGARGPDSHGPAERPMCCICQDMVSADPGENTCSPCGHVFHSECIHRLREVAEAQGRFLPAAYCPYRCHESNEAPAIPNPDESWDEIPIPNPANPNDEEGLAADVERERAEIEELFN